MNEFFTWSMIATYSGAVGVTSLFTQLFKNAGVIKRVPTRIFAYIVAAAVLIVTEAFTSGVTLEGAALALVNAAVVSLASNGAFEAVKQCAKPHSTGK